MEIAKLIQIYVDYQKAQSEMMGMGFSLQRVCMLAALLEHGDMTVTKLALKLGVTQQALGKAAKEAAKGGYVQVQTGKQDARSKILSITDLGRSFLDRVEIS